jgi:flagellar basal body-associated protein FliL
MIRTVLIVLGILTVLVIAAAVGIVWILYRSEVP